MPGTLYIVATPIGNLEDITLRAIRILCEVDIVLAEDTRVTKKLLDHISSRVLQPTTYNSQPKAKLISYHQHSKDAKKLEILQSIIAGKNIALVTDAGTPGISDPGNELVSFLVVNVPDIKIVPIPGPSAITASLSVSGMNVNKFVFLGFLPKKKRSKLFSWLKVGGLPFAFYESPKRVIKTLEVLEEEFGSDAKVLIARELTKLHETLYRGAVSNVELIGKKSVKGEIVIVIDPAKGNKRAVGQ